MLKVAYFPPVSRMKSYLLEETVCLIASSSVKEMSLKENYAIDYKQAVNDVLPFISNVGELQLWSEVF